jgi:hypothetical protein
MSGPKGAVVIPDSGRDDIVDTIASVRAYLPLASVVVVDDRPPPWRPRSLGPTCVVLPSLPYPRNAYGGLWSKECYAFRWVLANLAVDYVLRLDSDALVTGPGLDRLVAERFAKEPTLGVLGAYRWGADGGKRDFGPAARAISSEAGLSGLVLRPACRPALRRLLVAARSNGYELGEHTLGAVNALRPGMLARCQEMGWLDMPALAGSKLGEDWLVGMMARAAGYTLGDFGGPDGPIAVAWKGLPASPEELLGRGVLATHSVRAWKGRSEAEIRRYFAENRGGSSSQ